MTITEERPISVELPDRRMALVDPDAYVAACFAHIPAEHRKEAVVWRRLTRHNSLLFALLYFRDSLRGPDTGDKVTISEFHLDLFAQADRWAWERGGMMEQRDAWVAPRGSGKSTLMFLVIPAFLLAHGHRKYIIAFADTSGMATNHLQTFRRNIQQTNVQLQKHFPDFCRAAKRPGGQSDTDRQDILLTKSGAIFQAKGIDSTSLGAKVGDERPSVILFDDVEPPAENYSVAQADARLDLIRSAVFPMSLNAVVQFVGTTTMQGSIMDQLASAARDNSDSAPQWVKDEQIKVHYYPALLVGDDGVERSLWPARWRTEELQALRAASARSYALNYDNAPVNVDSPYWSEEMWTYGQIPLTHQIISIDPAVTTKRSSDYTGIAVVGWSAAEKKAVIRHTERVRLSSAELRDHVAALVKRFEVPALFIETNQGGEVWKSSVFNDMLDPWGRPLKIHEKHNTAKKELRWTEALQFWTRGWVLHETGGQVAPFEREAIQVPKAAHDDVTDAVSAGVRYFMDLYRKAPPRGPGKVTSQSYI